MIRKDKWLVHKLCSYATHKMTLTYCTGCLKKGDLQKFTLFIQLGCPKQNQNY
jgi:hypothetical protein